MSNPLATFTGMVPVVEKGDKGATERFRDYGDIAVGEYLQSGGDEDIYIDYVVFGGEWFVCIHNHNKDTRTNSPSNIAFWKQVSEQKRIATKLFLAQKAFIKNLQVDEVIITDQGEGNGNMLLKATKDGIECKSGIFENITFSGTMKGVSGSFKKLNCVDDSGNVVGSITFGSDGRMWFDGDMYNQGYNSDKKRGNRFYSSTIWCRGAFGHYEKTMAVVKGSYMVVYTKGTDKSGETVFLKSQKTSDGTTYYEIPLYSPNTSDASGMPIDVVVFNCSTAYYYAFTSMGNGKEWRVINGNDNMHVNFCDIGGWHKLGGGVSVNCMYVDPSLLSPIPSELTIGRGVFWTGETDLNW